jgi:antitoxin HigA-1
MTGETNENPVIITEDAGGWRVRTRHFMSTDPLPTREAAESLARFLGRVGDDLRAVRSLAQGAALTPEDELPPVHPGEVLLEEFIRPFGLSPIRTAQRLGVPRTRIERLVAAETRMTEDTALRLERLFGASAEFWMNLQTQHDLVLARRVAAEPLAAIQPIEADLAHA